MRCPFCAHDDSQVKDSRPTEDNTSIRRRRQCSSCGARFTTFERVQLREVFVVKSGDRRESFNRSKLEQSVNLACRKRGVAQERIDQLVSGIQRQVETAGESEVPSARIGEMVMDGLRQINREDGLTVLVNLHTLDTARAYCDRIIAMRQGRVFFDGTARQLTDDVVRDIYGLEGLKEFNEAVTSTQSVALTA